MRAILALLLLTQIASATEDNRAILNRKIAEHFAPVLLQRTGFRPKADAVTRFDFDGDFIGDNNWRNIEKFDATSYIYYDVIESKTHWFVTYAFFHARDYSRMCMWIICHENDLEGIILTIEKPAKADDLNGKVILIETQAHNRIHPSTTSFLKNSVGELQAAVFIQRWGHGVYPVEMKQNEIDKHQDELLIYEYTGKADDTKGAVKGNFGYDLISIKEEMWDRGQKENKMFMKNFDYIGSRYKVENIPYNFNGRKYSDGLANPPWAWTDILDLRIHRGDWFLDPAFAAKRNLDDIDEESFSLEYVYNPYLGIQ